MSRRESGGISTGGILSEIVRWACVAAIIILIGSKFTGNAVSSSDFATVERAVMQDLSLDKIQLADNQMIKRLYGIDPSSYDQVLLYYPTTNMVAEEMFLIKLSDPTGQQETVQSAIESRLATQKKNFDGYGTYQTAMLEASQIVVRGNYILFISAENPDQIVRNFESAL